jgi:hypothetical protein
MSRRWSTSLLVLPLVFGIAACGDDDDPPAASASAEAEPEGDDATACDTWLEIADAFNGEPTVEQMDPLFDELTANAPGEIADDIDVAVTTARHVLETGDFAAFETPEMGEALSNTDGYFFDACEADEKIEVTAVDYAFTGFPDELGAGLTFAKLTNGSTAGESHELLVMRRADGESASFEELLSLGEEEAAGRIEFVGAAFAASEGDESVAYLDLTPGDYVAVCFVPVGGGEDEGPDTVTHHDEGMVHEFTVS